MCMTMRRHLQACMAAIRMRLGWLASAHTVGFITNIAMPTVYSCSGSTSQNGSRKFTAWLTQMSGRDMMVRMTLSDAPPMLPQAQMPPPVLPPAQMPPPVLPPKPPAPMLLLMLAAALPMLPPAPMMLLMLPHMLPTTQPPAPPVLPPAPPPVPTWNPAASLLSVAANSAMTDTVDMFLTAHETVSSFARRLARLMAKRWRWCRAGAVNSSASCTMPAVQYLGRFRGWWRLRRQLCSLVCALADW